MILHSRPISCSVEYREIEKLRETLKPNFSLNIQKKVIDSDHTIRCGFGHTVFVVFKGTRVSFQLPMAVRMILIDLSVPSVAHSCFTDYAVLF